MGKLSKMEEKMRKKRELQTEEDEIKAALAASVTPTTTKTGASKEAWSGDWQLQQVLAMSEADIKEETEERKRKEALEQEALEYACRESMKAYEDFHHQQSSHGAGGDDMDLEEALRRSLFEPHDGGWLSWEGFEAYNEDGFAQMIQDAYNEGDDEFDCDDSHK